MKKTGIIISITLFVAVIFIVLYGFRFTPESAAKANSFVGNNVTLVSKVDVAIGTVLVYKKDNYFLTVVPHRYGLLWISHDSTTTKDIDDKNDLIRTVGWYSTTNSPKQGTVMVIQIKDTNVATITAGPDSDRVSKAVKLNQYVVFSWDKCYMGWQLNAVALSADGSNLYTYGYPPPSNVTDTKEFRWHKV
jgi:hypothetical protein